MLFQILHMVEGLCKYKVSKVGDRSRGWPEGSLLNSYYTEG